MKFSQSSIMIVAMMWHCRLLLISTIFMRALIIILDKTLFKQLSVKF